jgi:hypothetical protein
MRIVPLRLVPAVFAALALGACWGEERRAEPPATGQEPTTARTETADAQVRAAPSLEEILLPARTKRPKRPFASLAELRWAAAWSVWRDRIERAEDRVNAAFEGSPAEADPPAGALRRLARCGRDVASLGPVPSTRLAEVVRATAEACERYELAAAELEERGPADGLPTAAAFAYDHLLDADRELRAFVPGLDRDVDPLPFLDRPTGRSRIQIRYTHAASRLVGEQVIVRCYGLADWRREVAQAGGSPSRVAGFVQEHSVSGNLAPATCRWLDRLAYRKPPDALLDRARVAHALATLGHEAQHALGTRRESIAECYGMQRIRPLARALGATPEYAGGLAELFWERIYPYAPQRYQSERCRPGGPLDLRKQSPAWP